MNNKKYIKIELDQSITRSDYADYLMLNKSKLGLIDCYSKIFINKNAF